MSPLWLATRSTGLVAIALLTLVTVLGIVTAGGWASRQWPRPVVLGVHRTASLLTLAFLGGHLATTVLDGYVPVDWIDSVVPFGTPYRTQWLGLGAVALDLLLALVLTSLLRRRLPARVWRAVHWAAYAAWVLATVHMLGAGTDRMLDLAVAAVGTAVVVGATVLRFRTPSQSAPHSTAPVPTGPPAVPTAWTAHRGSRLEGSA